MATKYGVNATKRANSTIPSLESQGETNSPVKVAYDEYTLTADLAASDVIKMMKLPSGSRVHNVIFYFDDLDASGGTIDVGWEANLVDAADQDGFLAVVDVTSAGLVDMIDDQPTRPGVFKKFDQLGGDTQISLTTVGDTDATTGTVKLAIEYAIS